MYRLTIDGCVQGEFTRANDLFSWVDRRCNWLVKPMRQKYRYEKLQKNILCGISSTYIICDSIVEFEVI